MLLPNLIFFEQQKCEKMRSPPPPSAHTPKARSPTICRSHPHTIIHAYIRANALTLQPPAPLILCECLFHCMIAANDPQYVLSFFQFLANSSDTEGCLIIINAQEPKQNKKNPQNYTKSNTKQKKSNTNGNKSKATTTTNKPTNKQRSVLSP